MIDTKIKIGLETHVELALEKKLFCECVVSKKGRRNQYTCEICLGFPGSMPNININAIHLAVKFINLIKGQITEKLLFSRKHYYYCDSPKSYQLTQEDHYAIGRRGELKVFDFEKKEFISFNVKFDKILLEQNPGSQIGHHIDFNRAGSSLLEIVTEPIFFRKEEVIAYLRTLHFLLTVENITSEELNFKSDVNISYNNGPRVELKNLGSIEQIGQAIDYEISRQKIQNIEFNEVRNYNKSLKKTVYSRKKETSEEYLFKLEPDLPQFFLKNKEKSVEIYNKTQNLKNHFLINYSVTHFNFFDCFKKFSNKFKTINKEIIFSACLNSKIIYFLENLKEISSSQLSILIQELKYRNYIISEEKMKKVLLLFQDSANFKEKLRNILNDTFLIQKNFDYGAFLETNYAIELAQIKTNPALVNFLIGKVRMKNKLADIVSIRKFLDDYKNNFN